MKKSFENLVDEVLDKAKDLSEINSLHEGYAILLEEVDEFWDEVKKKPKNRDKKKLIEEIVQCAACCKMLYEKIKKSE